MSVIGIITNEGLSYSQQAADNEGWYVIPTGFAVSETAGELITSRTYADMKPTWYSAPISSREVINENSITFICTIPPGQSLTQKLIGEIYLTAQLLGTDFLLKLGQPESSLSYDPSGALIFRLTITIINISLVDNYTFLYTQATEISEHNLDPNAHPGFQPYLLGKVRVTELDVLQYLEDKFTPTFEEVGNKIGIKDEGITENLIDMMNVPSDGQVKTWDTVHQKVKWADYVGESGLTRYTRSISTSDPWVVTHNLGKKALIVQCWDSTYNLLTPTGIAQNNENQITITFGVGKAGIVVIIGMPIIDVFIQGYYEFSASPSWVYTHNFNSEYLMIAVWENTDSTGEYKLLPESIHKDSSNQLTVNWGGESVQGFMCVIHVGLDTGQYHEAVLSATQWNINHGLGNSDLMTFFWGLNGVEAITPNYVEKVDTNNLLVDFGTVATSGVICVISADADVAGWGIYTESIIASNTWVVTHNLDSEKIFVQCWDSNDKVVQPYDVTINGLNQITVDWAGVSVAGKVFVLNISLS